jgi:hypothetical protein
LHLGAAAADLHLFYQGVRQDGVAS